MPNEIKFKVENEVAFIAGVIDFSTVSTVCEQGNSWLKNSSLENCYFNFSQVTSCNSAATALILEWLRNANSVKKHIEIVEVPQRLRDLMQLAELEDVLQVEINQ